MATATARRLPAFFKWRLPMPTDCQNRQLPLAVIVEKTPKTRVRVRIIIEIRVRVRACAHVRTRLRIFQGIFSSIFGENFGFFKKFSYELCFMKTLYL